jgi:uncharacterized membrane protein
MIKKQMIAAILVFSILFLSVSFIQPVQAAVDCSVINVWLKSLYGQSSITIKPEGKYVIKGSIQLSLVSGRVYYLSESEGSIVLEDKTAERKYSFGNSFTFQRVVQTGNETAYLYINNAVYGGCRYRGDIYVKDSAGKPMLINHVPFEVYLYGVVP